MRPSEDDLIARYFAPIAGPGSLGLADDAALLNPRPGQALVLTKDMLIAGVHFFPDDPPDAIARKALRVNLSDLAAKAATPTGFLLGLGLPDDWTEVWLAAFAAGLSDDARAFACPLLGGDTVRMPGSSARAGALTLSVTAFGEVEAGRMVPRTAAQAGDVIYVSGTIGDAAIGLRVRQDDPADAAWIARLDPSACEALRDRYLLPCPRLGLRKALRDNARAAMDVSDGLMGDLRKMLRPAILSVAIPLAAVPLSPAVRAAIAAAPQLLDVALTGGDDYELLCAIPPDRIEAFEAEAREARIEVTRIGIAVSSDDEPSVVDAAARAIELTSHRYSHV